MVDDLDKHADTRVQVYYFYSYGTAAWMALQAAPMIASPTMIVALLSPEVREASSTCLPLQEDSGAYANGLPSP